ncbi:nucleotidyltransferase family protein (plasmid) [Coraliomargarita sp. W4R53]
MCESLRVCGVVLAAGAGSRYGSPKGLARAADGTPWVHLAIRMLRDAGCADVVVLIGARGPEVAELVGDRASVVAVPDWAAGLSATIRVGLTAVSDCDVAVITPVDTPDAAPDAVRRIVAALGATPRATLAQAMYGGSPGHPVAVGAAHFEALALSLAGDRGAKDYLAAHGAVEIECGDLWSGLDIDTR